MSELHKRKLTYLAPKLLAFLNDSFEKEIDCAVWGILWAFFFEFSVFVDHPSQFWLIELNFSMNTFFDIIILYMTDKSHRNTCKILTYRMKVELIVKKVMLIRIENNKINIE